MLYDLPNQDSFNSYLQSGFLMFDLLTFIALFFIPAHYGKFFDEKKKLFFTLSGRAGWIIEEIPNTLISFYFILRYLTESDKTSYIPILIISPFIAHYIHRGIIYPFKIGNSKKMPIEITLLGSTFCIFNATMQNRSIFLFSDYSLSSILNPQAIIGLFLFVLGMYLNIYHDYLMIKLRKGADGYIIPNGFLFKYVSCPNYLGEMIEWIGFALFCQTFSAWIFVISTFSNLFPRALKYHKWYNEKFGDEYPKDRKAIIPYII